MAVARRNRRTFMVPLALAVATALAPSPSQAAPTVPVRIRILKGSRQGPPAVDPKLADLHVQLGMVAYQRWDEVGEKQTGMEMNKPVSLPLPDGSALELTLVDARKDTVTFQVKAPIQKTPTRLTISKDQRIVYGVTEEKDGAALFATVRPWP